MKKSTLVSFAFIFIASIANAQINKGSILLGGNINLSAYDISNSPEYKNNFFYVQPSLGFTVKDNNIVGFSLAYSHGKQNISSTQTSETKGYGGGVFLRNYLTLGKGFYLYGEAGTNYFHNETDQAGSSFQTQKISTVDLHLYPGVAYRASKRFLLEIAMNNLLSLNYSTTNQQYSTPSSYSTKSSQWSFTINANPNTNLSLGFRILLGR